jgi:hypothetical protein
LHAVAATRPDAAGLTGLIEELTECSPDFAGFWQRHDIRRRRGEPKTLSRNRHTTAGRVP